VELILKRHACRHVPLLPKYVDHLAPPADLRIAGFVTRGGNDIRSQTQKYWRVGHGVTHKARQKLISVNNRKLPTGLRGFDVYSFCFQTGTKCLPVGGRRYKDDTLTVGNGTGCKPTNGPVQKLLILVSRGPAEERRPSQSSIPFGAVSDVGPEVVSIP
jgi:hypothetical protein